MLDRLTDQAHMIETGNESFRFHRTLEKRKGKMQQCHHSGPTPVNRPRPILGGPLRLGRRRFFVDLKYKIFKRAVKKS